jgi:hypothetical protein
MDTTKATPTKKIRLTARHWDSIAFVSRTSYVFVFRIFTWLVAIWLGTRMSEWLKTNWDGSPSATQTIMVSLIALFVVLDTIVWLVGAGTEWTITWLEAAQYSPEKE